MSESHKHLAVDYAIAGIIEGGYSATAAEGFRTLFTMLYESGYNEAIRERSPNQTWQD